MTGEREFSLRTGLIRFCYAGLDKSGDLIIMMTIMFLFIEIPSDTRCL
jgi:hypothetical protein